jgi:hypothetical protein
MKSDPAVPPDSDPRIERLLAYWRSIRPAPDRLPGRRNFEPTDLPDLLRWLWLVDVEHTPLRFRCRLFGTGHRDVLGRDFTGHWLDEVFADFPATQTHGDFVAALAGEPRWYRGRPDYAASKGYDGIERLVLPLAADGVTVDMLLGLTLYRRDDGTMA